MATFNVTDATFDEQVIKSSVPVVIDFWAEWCGPCKQIGPALEELSEEYGEKIKIAKINVDENPDSPSKLGVRGIPALFIFKNGEMVSSKIGAAPKTDLKNWIDESTQISAPFSFKACPAKYKDPQIKIEVCDPVTFFLEQICLIASLILRAEYIFCQPAFLALETATALVSDER